MSAPLLNARHIGPQERGLRATGLTRSGRAPLFGVNFEARAGELTVFLSKDTSGQALLRAAIGLDPLDRGVSKLFGRHLVQLPDGSNRLSPGQVGILGANPAIRVGYSVDQELGSWLDDPTTEESRERIAQVGASLGFEGLGTAIASDLPLALAHRVAIGRALVPGPAMLAVLNPYSGLPLRDRLMLEGLLRVIATDFGLAVIYATDQEDSAARAHHLLRLVGGTVCQDTRGMVEIQRALESPAPCA